MAKRKRRTQALTSVRRKRKHPVQTIDAKLNRDILKIKRIVEKEKGKKITFRKASEIFRRVVRP